MPYNIPNIEVRTPFFDKYTNDVIFYKKRFETKNVHEKRFEMKNINNKVFCSKRFVP